MPPTTLGWAREPAAPARLNSRTVVHTVEQAVAVAVRLSREYAEREARAALTIKADEETDHGDRHQHPVD